MAIKQQIFIGGCSRSGTTLLGAMIGAHSDMICSPESHFKMDVLRALEKGKVNANPSALMTLIQRHWRFKIWELELPPIELFNDDSDEPVLARLLNWIIDQYAQQQERSQASKWVDHTPENISYAHSLLQLFPNARFIHIVRDGRAVAASIMPLDWGPNSIMKTSRWWMRMMSFGLAAEKALGPEIIMQVKYEDLVLEPEPTMRSISQFLGIEYEPAMLHATGFNPPSYTTRQHKLVGNRPDASVVNRWETKLTSRQIEIFEHQTRDFLSFLGYPLHYGMHAKGPSFGEVQQDKLRELIQGEVMNKLKWLKRSYPLWLSRDFYSQGKFTDTNN
ncbi:MAG: sulfotransferase [Ardenticatenaceae bacterium]|nr:sulfotransferase [Ardenticatenaceae bacterium]MCB9445710.1 sulfotransferase [Ardenticatenaceae bacterium]